MSKLSLSTRSRFQKVDNLFDRVLFILRNNNNNGYLKLKNKIFFKKCGRLSLLGSTLFCRRDAGNVLIRILLLLLFSPTAQNNRKKSISHFLRKAFNTVRVTFEGTTRNHDAIKISKPPITKLKTNAKQ